MMKFMFVFEHMMRCLPFNRGSEKRKRLVKAILKDHASLFTRQLSRLCGRHAKNCRLVQELLSLGEQNLTDTFFQSTTFHYWLFSHVSHDLSSQQMRHLLLATFLRYTVVSDHTESQKEFVTCAHFWTISMMTGLHFVCCQSLAWC